MSRARLLTFVCLTAVIAACSASTPTAPTSPRGLQPRPQRDGNPPCDSTTLSGYGNPNGHC
jgi:hypothetical protein